MTTILCDKENIGTEVLNLAIIVEYIITYIRTNTPCARLSLGHCVCVIVCDVYLCGRLCKCVCAFAMER